MHEDDAAAAEIHADRMVAAMQCACQAHADGDDNDASVLLLELRPGTPLCAAIRDYVAHLKGTGLSPEQLLVVVKQSVSQFERIPRQIEARPLTEGVISLCIEK